MSIWRAAHFRLQARVNTDGGEGGGLEKTTAEAFPDENVSLLANKRAEAVSRRLAKDSIDVKEAFKKHREDLKKRKRLEQQREKLMEKSAFFRQQRNQGLGGSAKRMKVEGGAGGGGGDASPHSNSSKTSGLSLPRTDEEKEQQKKILEKILSVRSAIQEHVDKVTPLHPDT